MTEPSIAVELVRRFRPSRQARVRIVVDDQVVQLDAAALEQHIAACQEALALLRAEGELG